MKPSIPHYPRGRGQAFTLVELLSIIAIIAVLAAILFPAIGSVFKSIDIAKCTSNLRQLYHAHRMYAAEHNDLIIHAQRFNDLRDNPDKYPGMSQDYNLHWWQIVIKYGYIGRPDIPNRWTDMKNSSGFPEHNRSGAYYTVLGCPSVQKVRLSRQTEIDPDSGQMIPKGTEGKNSGYLTYGSNQLLSTCNNKDSFDMTFGRVADPSKTILLGDQKIEHDANGAGIWIANTPIRFPEGAHDGRANLIFCDGHVELREIDDIPDRSARAEVTNIVWYGRYR